MDRSEEPETSRQGRATRDDLVDGDLALDGAAGDAVRGGAEQRPTETLSIPYSKPVFK